MEQRVVLQRDGDISLLELCSPPHNPTDQLFFAELAAIMPQLENNPCRGLIVRGRGRHFSSGADIKELVTRIGHGCDVAMDESSYRSLSIFEKLARLDYPVVATIEGCCLGSGMELALACHYRIAAGNALFSLPETGFGLMPGCGGTSRLPKLVGVGKSIEMILSSRNYAAEEALRMNLIDCIVEKKKLMAMATAMIRALPVAKI